MTVIVKKRDKDFTWSLKKHAKGRVAIDLIIDTQNRRKYTWMRGIELYPEFKDLNESLNIKGQHIDFVYKTYEIQTDLETLEITLAILEENRYYDVSDLKDIIDFIKGGK